MARHYVAAVLATLIAFMATAAATRAATYPADEAGEYMKRWLILGAIPIFDGEPDTSDTAAIAAAIDRDFLADAGGEASAAPREGDAVTVAGQEFVWTAIESEDDSIDLKAFCGDHSFVVAYAYAEIEALHAGDTVLGFGSDDEAQIWVNGELAHTNPVPRSVVLDDDTVTVSLREGVNRLLIKVQNREQGWGFACRILDSEGLGVKLLDAALAGQIDDIATYVQFGADLTAARYGLTAVQTARVQGYPDIVDALVAAGADPGEHMPTPAEIVDALFTDIVKDDLPGAAVLVSRDGEVLFGKGYGLADVGNRVPVTPDTKFRIGSVSKQFTAAAILKLQEQGKLSVTDTLSTFLPNYPRGDEVTLHHLLTHTSGIHNYTTKADFLDLATVPVTPEDQIDYFKDDPYDFDPGEEWVYSNSGYYLLAYVVQVVSEQSFGDFLREQFLEPLGMHDSGLHDSSTVLTHEAFGYTYASGAVAKALNWDMSRALGAGNVYSTVHDLQRWNEAVFSHEALTEETMQAVLTPARLNDGSIADALGGQYGYGWMTTDMRGMQVISHSGGLHGFVAFLAWVPEKRLTVTVLHNSYLPIPGMNPAALVNEAAQVFLWEELPPRTSLAAADIDPAVFDRFAGDYVLAGMVKFGIRREGDVWSAVVGDAPQELTPLSDTEFVVKGTSVVLRFVLDDEGNLSHIEREESGSISEAYPAEEEEEGIAVPAELLAEYAGKYEFRNLVLTVTSEEDHLYAQMTGQGKYEIYGRSETEFFWKVAVASVEFVRDESGEVSQAVIHQGPAVIPAVRVK